MMTTETTTTPEDLDLTPKHWKFVQDLLEDIEDERNRDRIAEVFGGWKLSVKAFRRVETKQMIINEPNGVDFTFHKACLLDLMGIGQWLKLAASCHRREDLEDHKIDVDVLDAANKGLQNSFEAYHGNVSESRIAEITSKLFNEPTT